MLLLVLLLLVWVPVFVCTLLLVVVVVVVVAVVVVRSEVQKYFECAVFLTFCFRNFPPATPASIFS